MRGGKADEARVLAQTLKRKSEDQQGRCQHAAENAQQVDRRDEEPGAPAHEQRRLPRRTGAPAQHQQNDEGSAEEDRPAHQCRSEERTV